jgi:ABC-type Fe3+ transport system substrate-binding protein
MEGSPVPAHLEEGLQPEPGGNDDHTNTAKAKTEDMVRGWVNNLATSPLPDDTKAMEAVAAGQCDLTMVNTYYFGRLMAKKPESAAGDLLAQPGL